jgi:uncharacterized protein YjbI with pentapeptide repeats
MRRHIRDALGTTKWWMLRAWNWPNQFSRSKRVRVLAKVPVVVAVVILVLALMYGIWVVADPQTAEDRIGTLQIIAGLGVTLFVATGSYIAWRTYQVNREGQITERFTRAIDQLGATDSHGNPRIEIRLGGIYALQRIAQDSDRDYPQIIQTLTAYVRQNAPRRSDKEQAPTAASGAETEESESVAGRSTEILRPREDIAAVLDVLRQRSKSSGAGEDFRLDLSNVNLNGALLMEADLQWANLAGAALVGVNLIRANVRWAVLMEADLQLAELNGADLSGANFHLANFSGANLGRASLIAADLSGSNLSGVILSDADLRGTDLREAFLQGAFIRRSNLSGALLSRANLHGSDLRETDLSETNLLMANLNWANLRGADLGGAILWNKHFGEADLTDANLEGANLQGTVVTRAQLAKAKNVTEEQLRQIHDPTEARSDV